MALWVTKLAAKPKDLVPFLGPMWWKERTNSAYPLTPVCTH